MTTKTICALAILAAFSVPGHAEKIAPKGEMALSTSKMNVVPKQASTASAATPSSGAGAPVGVAGKPIMQSGADAKSAAISTSNFKQNIDLKELNEQRPAGSGGSFADIKARMMGVEGQGSKAMDATFVGGGRQVGSGAGEAIQNAVGEKGPISGAKYGDTFGGERINRKHQGSKDDYSGGGRGRASSGGQEDGDRTIIGASPGKEDTGMSREEYAKTVADMLRMEGGRSSGNAEKDTAELGYAQSVGRDGYAATKDMSAEDRKNHWSFEARKQQIKRERDDDMGTAGGPVTRQEVLTNMRGVSGRRGGAGGGDDGRTDQQSSGGGGGGMMVVNKAEGAVREGGVGTLNMDAVLKINTQVNPGAANATR